MKFLLIFFFTFLLPCNKVLAYELVEPILSAESVLEIAENYLKKEKGISLERFKLVNFTYSYLTLKRKEGGGQWSLYYKIPDKIKNGRRTVAIGSHFSIYLSNDKKPKIKFYGGA